MFDMKYVLSRQRIAQPIWKHRYTSHGIIFAFMISLLAFLLGVFVSTNPQQEDGKTSSSNSNTTNVSSTVNDYSISRDICYYMVYLAWSARYITQMFLNINRGRTIGLSIDGIVWNLLGNGCYMISVIIDTSFLGPQSKVVRSDTEHIRQIVFAIFNFVICSLLMFQCVMFDSSTYQFFSPFPISAAAVIIILSAIFLIILLSTNVSISIYDSISLWIKVLKYVYIACSIMRFVPQIQRNRKYKIFVGYDMINLCLDFCGGACLILYILFSCPGGAFVRNRNEQCNLASMILDAMAQIVHGGVVCILSVVLMVQCFMYRSNTHLTSAFQTGSGVEQSICLPLTDLTSFNVERNFTSWTCDRCTLVNEIHLDYCAVCNFSRPEIVSGSGQRSGGTECDVAAEEELGANGNRAIAV